MQLRDHSKKKKGLRDLKLRISLPPENKTSLNRPATAHELGKSFQRPADFPNHSFSSQTLDRSLNQSHGSLTHLNGTPLSRNEHRLSMLDLGYGKLETYTKLEKLGEGNESNEVERRFPLRLQERMRRFTKARRRWDPDSSP